MKKMLTILILTLFVSTTVMAASYNIDENKDLELSGIKKIILDLNTPNCAICIKTGSQTYGISGGGRAGMLALSLNGDLRSNNKKAVPSLITEKNGSTLTVRLFKERNLFFGLAQSGSVHFKAVLPDYFDGDLEVYTSSGDSQVSGVNSKTIVVKSSSGDVDVSEIEANDITIGASSGEITAQKLSAVGALNFKSSSGDIEAGELLAETAELRASSGRIEIGRLRTTGRLYIHASSGRISADHLDGGDVTVEASSGRISINELKAKELLIDSSSGDITVSELSSGPAEFSASSGDTTIGVEQLDGNINVKSSSGGVELTLPAGTAFSADLKASSGKIKSEFKLLTELTGERKNEILGDANGGGYTVKVKASSGNISILER